MPMTVLSQKPQLTRGVVAQEIQKHYALRGELSPLPGEREQNFKLTVGGNSANQACYVCKICNASDDIEFVSAQANVLQRLGDMQLSGIPNMIGTTIGHSFAYFETQVGNQYVLRLLSYLPGKPLAEAKPYSVDLMRSFAHMLGNLDKALFELDEAAFHYEFHWDLAKADIVISQYSDLIIDHQMRSDVRGIGDFFNSIVAPLVGELRTSLIHNDANDYNVLVADGTVTGIVDFGDMIYSYTICDLAIAIAYAVLDAEDPLSIIVEMTVAYNKVMLLERVELSVLFPLVMMRMATSVCLAAHQISLRPDDEYLGISQIPIQQTLPRLLRLPLKLVEDTLLSALVESLVADEKYL